MTTRPLLIVAALLALAACSDDGSPTDANAGVPESTDTSGSPDQDDPIAPDDAITPNLAIEASPLILSLIHISEPTRLC